MAILEISMRPARSRLMQKLGLKDVGGIVRFSLLHRLISLDWWHGERNAMTTACHA